MSSNYYPSGAPFWFVPYGYKPSEFYDERAATWYYLVLGSKNGTKDTFRQYLFKLVGNAAEATEVPIGIPIIHGSLTPPAAGRLYIFGQSERDLFWQDGPALSQNVMQRTTALISAPQAHYRTMTKEQHDFLPVRWPGLFDREWGRYNP